MAALMSKPLSDTIGFGSCGLGVSFAPPEESSCNDVCGTKLVLEDSGRDETTLHPGTREVLDFGTLRVQERRSFRFRLFSRCSRTDFIWQVFTAAGIVELPGVTSPPYISVSPMQGGTPQSHETEITVEYAAPEAHVLDGTSLQLLAMSRLGDACYTLELMGRTRPPSVSFSVSSYDFGPCFVKPTAVSTEALTGELQSPLHGPSPAERFDLVVTNADTVDCWVTTTFVSTPFLDVQLQAAIIPAGQSIIVPLVFTPLDCTDYDERVEFVVNCVPSYVDIKGQGCLVNLEVVSTNMQNIDFGVADGVQPVTRQFTVVNRSLRTVDLCLNDLNGALTDRSVTWRPTGSLLLQPQEESQIDLLFAPDHHIEKFNLPLYAMCNMGENLHLVDVSGKSPTANVKLSEHVISFGDVTWCSSAVCSVHLHNFGDLGVNFRFDMPPEMAALYCVEPTEGYAAPDEDILVHIEFLPTRTAIAAAGCAIGQIRCLLDPRYQQDPVELSVQGRGIDDPDSATKMLEEDEIAALADMFYEFKSLDMHAAAAQVLRDGLAAAPHHELFRQIEADSLATAAGEEAGLRR